MSNCYGRQRGLHTTYCILIFNRKIDEKYINIINRKYYEVIISVVRAWWNIYCTFLLDLIRPRWKLSSRNTQTMIPYCLIITFPLGKTGYKYVNVDNRVINIPFVYHVSIHVIKHTGLFIVSKSSVYVTGSVLGIHSTFCFNHAMCDAQTFLGFDRPHK